MRADTSPALTSGNITLSLAQSRCLDHAAFLSPSVEVLKPGPKILCCFSHPKVESGSFLLASQLCSYLTDRQW